MHRNVMIVLVLNRINIGQCKPRMGPTGNTRDRTRPIYHWGQ
jgi:hypothetical protein